MQPESHSTRIGATRMATQDSGFTDPAGWPMPLPMTSEEEMGLDQIDAAIHFGALLVRAAVYTFVYAVADLFGCGRAILTGIWLGDVVSHVVQLAWNRRDTLVQGLAELALLGIVFLFVRSQLVWPQEPPLRAILGLAAFGVFSSRIGGSLFTQLGPGARGFA